MRKERKGDQEQLKQKNHKWEITHGGYKVNLEITKMKNTKWGDKSKLKHFNWQQNLPNKKLLVSDLDTETACACTFAMVK